MKVLSSGLLYCFYYVTYYIKILENTYLKNVNYKFNIYTMDLKMYNSQESMGESGGLFLSPFGSTAD